MYPSKEEFMTNVAMEQKFNSFQYWREPIQDISFADLCLPSVEVVKENNVLPVYDSFLYWREPIPEIDEDLLE